MRASLILTALLLLATPATAQIFQRDTLRAGPVLQEMTSPSAMACQAACDLNGQCAAWSWMHPGVQSPAAMCRLQAAEGVPQTDVCCISGVSRESASLPQPQIASAPDPRPMTVASRETPRQSPVTLMRPAPQTATQQAPQPQPPYRQPAIVQTTAPEKTPPIRQSAMGPAASPAPHTVYVPYSARPRSTSPQEEVALNFDPTARGGDEDKEDNEKADKDKTMQNSESAEKTPDSETDKAPQPALNAPDTVAPALLRKEEPASRRPLYSVQREYAEPRSAALTPQEALQNEDERD